MCQRQTAVSVHSAPRCANVAWLGAGRSRLSTTSSSAPCVIASHTSQGQRWCQPDKHETDAHVRCEQHDKRLLEGVEEARHGFGADLEGTHSARVFYTHHSGL
jgi:hypothetical protein